MSAGILSGEAAIDESLSFASRVRARSSSRFTYVGGVMNEFGRRPSHRFLTKVF